MYIQITTRCNMRCDHCCYSCGKIGEDMNLDTFRKAIANSDGYITIGGGEPTVHPQFEKFLLLAVGEAAKEMDGLVYVITNGKHKERALMLFGLAKAGAIGAELSLDRYHEAIDPETVELWQKEAKRAKSERSSFRDTNEPSMVGIRNTTENRPPMPNGRAVTVLGVEKEGDYRCPCDGPVIKPSGEVMACGCDDAISLGSVHSGWEMPDYDDFPEYYLSYCSRDFSQVLV